MLLYICVHVQWVLVAVAVLLAVIAAFSLAMLGAHDDGMARWAACMRVQAVTAWHPLHGTVEYALQCIMACESPIDIDVADISRSTHECTAVAACAGAKGPTSSWLGPIRQLSSTWTMR